MDYLDVTAFIMEFYKKLQQEFIKFDEGEKTPYIKRLYTTKNKKKIEFGIKNISKDPKNENWVYYCDNVIINGLDELIKLLK